MSKLNCIIVEDEPLAAKVLSDYISQVPFLELKESFKDAILASEYLRHNTVDLIFLDIHLPKLKGMAFLKTLKNPPAVIITTAYHQYAVEGFELNVTDYLLKPFEFDRFFIAVNKVRSGGVPQPNADASGSQTLIQKETETHGIKDHLFLNVQKKKVKLSFSDIVYIESQREYIKIVTTKHEYISKMSTHEIEALLPPHLFKRIHRSYIISIGKIESYSAEIVEVNGVSIPIGRGYRDVLENL
jgi:two-component system, LytTR family, response regulator